MRIINAEEKQYETVRAFYHSLIDDLKKSDYYIGWEKDVYPAPDFLKKSIRQGELYIISENQKIIAAMVLNHEYNEGYKKIRWTTEAADQELLVIHALGVHPDHAGRGYAKALVRKAIDLAVEKGMKAVRLDVLDGNFPAERLYIGSGFKYISDMQMFYEDTGWTNFRLYEYVIL